MQLCKFLNGETFYCTHCDSSERIVKSDDPKTGVFFCQFGHEWSPEKQKTTEDYTQVIFAYCFECVHLLGLKKMIAVLQAQSDEWDASFKHNEDQTFPPDGCRDGS